MALNQPHQRRIVLIALLAAFVAGAVYFLARDDDGISIVPRTSETTTSQPAPEPPNAGRGRQDR